MSDQKQLPPAHPRAVIFDFDGTLADSFEAITASVNFVANSYGLPGWTKAEIKPKVGWGLPHLMSVLFPHHDVQQSVTLYREHHATVLRSGTKLLPGVTDTLALLKHQGQQLAVCSNKAVSFTRQLLGILGISSYFTHVLGPEDVNGHAKPAPDMLREALRRLMVTPAEVLYIGDMEIDVQTARAAGVTVWVVPTGTQSDAALRAAGPDHVFRDMWEVRSVLDHQNIRP